MSRLELVEAYQNGELGRSSFVKALTAAGVSLSAALSYAVALAPDAAEAHHIPPTEAQAVEACQRLGSESTKCQTRVLQYCQSQGFSRGFFYYSGIGFGAGVACFYDGGEALRRPSAR